MNKDSREQRHEDADCELSQLDDCDLSDLLLLVSTFEDEDITNSSYDSPLNTGETSGAHSDSFTSSGEAFCEMASDNLDVKNKLQNMIKEKMKSEGKGNTVMDSITNTAVHELTPEDEKKRIQKQERNKEAARKSRQKKKENNSKLIEKNMALESENQDLKYSVHQLTFHNTIAENFLATHRCLARNIIAEQDQGDNVCQETGTSKPLCYIPDVEPQEGRLWCGDGVTQDDKILDYLYDMSLSLKVYPRPPQKIEHILSSLQQSQLSLQEDQFQMQGSHSLIPESQSSVQESQSSLQGIQSSLQGDQSQLVTSGSSYEPKQCLSGHSYLIAEQVNGEFNKLCKVTTNLVPNLTSEVMGNVTNIRATQYESTPVMFKGNDLSLVARKSLPYARYRSPWSTETDNQNDEMEALLEVSRTVQPPQEKKPRLE